MVSTPDLKATTPILILSGPTATGKTALALELCRLEPSLASRIEIINADSMLVYRGMDIGTAKPSLEERARIPHHLIDIREPDESFSAGDFVREATDAIHEIEARGKLPLIVGGTGFYLKALLYGLWDAPAADPSLRADLDRFSNDALLERLRERDPASALQIGGNDRYRLIRALEMIAQSGKSPSELKATSRSQPDPRFLLWVVDRAPRELEQRVRLRTRQMLEDGLLDEVRLLRARHPSARALSAVGYAQACAFLDGKAPAGRKIQPGIDGLAQEIELATRQLVKRQRTWFRAQATARWYLLGQDKNRLITDFRNLLCSRSS